MNTQQQQGADIESVMRRAAELGQDPERVAQALGVVPERCREILAGLSGGAGSPASTDAASRGSTAT